ncbi:MAG: hypothetical protein U9O54_04820, partial [Chloroflexota bacterium]|nr:hypothetical protein [Chloroflexota bacterium]
MRKTILFLLALGLSSCLATPTPAPLPTITVTPSPSSTATVEWFPATETPIPAPTKMLTPIPEFSPGTGDIIFSDDFSTAGTWLLEDTSRGSVNINNNAINLVINTPGVFLYSVLEEALFTNFYVEITARTNLCVGKDEYGLMFRAARNVSYYRYSLSCDGEVRLDRILSGVAFSPQDWIPSASVPSAAPGESRLGVWANNGELHFFINGNYQFAVIDDQIALGSFGVFARSVGENAVTVSFTDLVVREIK